MPCYEMSVAVAAPVATVWRVTRDVESWPQWSPTMDRVTAQSPGPIAVGSSVQVRQPWLPPATWVVDQLIEHRRFCWHTRGPGYRIIADHVLAASPDGAGTDVRLTATMSGPLALPLWLLMARTIRSYVDQEAAALKQHCECS